MIYGIDTRKDKIISLILGNIYSIKQEVKRLKLIRKFNVPKFTKSFRDIPTKRLIGINGTLQQKLMRLQQEKSL